MLGHRGCRLGIAYPEISAMQARAVFEAAAECIKKGIKAKPEIMIPLVGFKKELDLEIAHTAEFFSFGTNDLTQTALGMSRDDSGTFLPHYAEMEIVKKNPFATIDQTGVGQLVDIA